MTCSLETDFNGLLVFPTVFIDSGKGCTCCEHPPSIHIGFLFWVFAVSFE